MFNTSRSCEARPQIYLAFKLVDPFDGFLAFRRQFQFHLVLHILHGLAEYRIVHELEEIHLEIMLGVFSLYGVEVFLLCQPV